mmetsp:Transcript_35118/g.74142  ORF Transcript_35118/g.74142 Transcript_35118/m.74142 type:complete len:176 (-) Transcript_35118:637-1164(-)
MADEVGLLPFVPLLGDCAVIDGVSPLMPVLSCDPSNTPMIAAMAPNTTEPNPTQRNFRCTLHQDVTGASSCRPDYQYQHQFSPKKDRLEQWVPVERLWPRTQAWLPHPARSSRRPPWEEWKMVKASRFSDEPTSAVETQALLADLSSFEGDPTSAVGLYAVLLLILSYCLHVFVE